MRVCYETWCDVVECGHDLKFRDMTIAHAEPGTKTQRVFALMKKTVPGMTQTEFIEISKSSTHKE